jgi:hypothetical protein
MTRYKLLICSLTIFIASSCSTEIENQNKKERGAIISTSESKLNRISAVNNKKTQWKIIESDGSRVYRKFFIETGDGSKRIIELQPDNGYIVHKVFISCRTKSYADMGFAHIRYSEYDNKIPVKQAPKNTSSPNLMNHIDEICIDDRNKFNTNLLGAVKILRIEDNKIRQYPKINLNK